MSDEVLDRDAFVVVVFVHTSPFRHCFIDTSNNAIEEILV